MAGKHEIRRTSEPEMPRDPRAEEILEFVHNDEQESLCDERLALNHQRDMPALQEYLEHMHELDSQPGPVQQH